MKLIIDLDSTVADLMSPWYVWLVQKGYTTKHHSSEDVTSYDWLQKEYSSSVNDYFLEDPVYLYKNCVHPIPAAKYFVNWCVDHFTSVEILTHSSKKETERAKTWWVKEHLEFDNIRFFETLEDKFKHLGNSILVDDYNYHCIMHSSRNKCHSIIFDYNREYGWSKPENYTNLMQKEKVDEKLLHYCYSYRDVMKSLLELKHE